MKDTFHIKLVFQVSRIPYLIFLDLRVLCESLATVAKQTFMRRFDANFFVKYIYERWNTVLLIKSITKVFNCLRNGLVVIVEGNDGNESVETKRGKNRNLDLSVE